MILHQYPVLQKSEIDPDPESLSKAEAKRHFAFVVGMCDSRLAILKQACSSSLGRPIADLDESPDSLSLIWNFAISIIAKREPTEPEKSERKNRFGSWVSSLVKRGAEINENDTKKLENSFDLSASEMTNFTKTIALDVGFYFSKVLTGKFPEIKWGMETRKSFSDYNKPSLVLIPGLKDSPTCDPFGDVSSCFAEYLRDKTDKNLLLERYHIYERELLLFKKKNAK